MAPSQAARERARFEEDMVAQHSYLALARRIRQFGQPVVGLWPAPVSVRFDDLPRDLAQALASLGTTVGVVVPRERWCEDPSRGKIIVTRLSDSVDSITLVWPNSSNPVGALEQTLPFVCERHACALLDLVGWDETAVEELALLPGVAIVILVAQGQISEFALARLGRRIPTDRLVGAVLVESSSGRGLA